METKRSKVKSRKQVGDKDNYGNYSFFVIFENNDEGWYKSKSEQPDKYIIGTEEDYTIEKKVSKKGEDFFVIKHPSDKKPFKQYGKSPEELKLSAASWALAYAKDCWINGVIPEEKVYELADSNYDWMVKKAGI